MMFVFWTSQILFDAGVLVLAWFWLRRQHGQDMGQEKAALVDTLNSLRTRIVALEAEKETTTRLVDAELQKLIKLREEIRERFTSRAFDPIGDSTDEAVELSQMVLAAEHNDIPSVRHLERTKERLRVESKIDLKTLLCEQLS